jgi:UDP-N-acetylmuramoylalanine--D-glutamate ligase
MSLGKRHARVTIMGLGLFGGGVGAARFWANLGSRVTVTDLRGREELEPSLRKLEGLGCTFVLGGHRQEDFIHADLVVVNPAVKPDNRFVTLAREHGAKITTEVGTLLRLVHGPLFAVTGSNGKSTTTALLGAVMQRAEPATLVGGNIGGSLLDAVREHRPSAPVVLELSSFQLHYLREQRRSPNIAVITNLSPNHLDWHRSLEAYYDDKRTILRYQFPEDAAVLNAADPILRSWADTCRQRVCLFSVEEPDWPNAVFVRDGTVVVRLGGLEKDAFPVEALGLPGRHNLENALAATGAAYLYLHSTSFFEEAFASFRGLPDRIELVGEKRGIRFFNDSIATTPEAAIAALQALEGPIVLIAGGYDKGADFGELGRVIAERAEASVLLGETAEAIREAVRDAGQGAAVVRVESFEDALERAVELCPRGGAVLLSPGCASYGLFRNYQERGERFRALVAELPDDE